MDSVLLDSIVYKFDRLPLPFLTGLFTGPLSKYNFLSFNSKLKYDVCIIYGL